MHKKTFELGFFYTVAAIIAVLLFFVFEPFLVPLFMAAIIASVFYPIHRRILGYLKGKSRIASTISLIMIVLLIIGPFLFIGSLLSQEAVGVYNKLSNNGFTNIESVAEAVNTVVQSIVPGFTPIDVASLNISQTLRSWTSSILQNLSGIFVAGFSLSLSTLIFLISLFFFFKDGEDLVTKTVVLSPLEDKYDRKIAHQIGVAFDSVVRGSIITALAQGVLAAIGFIIAGAAAPVLLGSLSAMGSFIPGVGASLVVIVTALYLILTGSYVAGIFLLLWAFLVVGLADNFIRPLVIEKGIKVHPLIILLSILGGIAYMGPVGVIAGPVLISIAVAFIEVHPLILNHK